jgi:quinol monooxygenase YgiN
VTASASSAASPTSATLPSAETPVVLVVQFHAQPGGEADLEARLLEMARKTTGETGCLRYDIHHDESDASHLVLLESWADQESLDAHMATGHVEAFLADLPGLTSQDIEMLRLRRLQGRD